LAVKAVPPTIRAFRNKGSSKTSQNVLEKVHVKNVLQKSWGKKGLSLRFVLLRFWPFLCMTSLKSDPKIQGAPKKNLKKQGRVGRLFLRGIAFFWPIL
jgi:hypothetical protein